MKLVCKQRVLSEKVLKSKRDLSYNYYIYKDYLIILLDAEFNKPTAKKIVGDLLEDNYFVIDGVEWESTYVEINYISKPLFIPSMFINYYRGDVLECIIKKNKSQHLVKEKEALSKGIK